MRTWSKVIALCERFKDFRRELKPRAVEGGDISPVSTGQLAYVQSWPDHSSQLSTSTRTKEEIVLVAADYEG
jgi:hypothetical protein